MATPNKAEVVTEASVATAENRRKELAKTYKAEDTREVSISPLYRPYLGRMLQISINGITVVVPVDGSIVKLPVSFADEVSSRVMAIDATLKKAERMADVNNNIEHSPGAFGMF